MTIFTRFPRNADGSSDDIVEGNSTIVTTGLWSGDTGSLQGSTAYLYDTQLDKSGEYFMDVFNTDPASVDTSEVQFSIAYGHVNGGGAPTLNDDEQAKLPTKAIYSQYRNLLLEPTDTKFKFQGVESDHIYVLNFQRARYKEKLDPGNWQLPLSGTNGRLTFIDDSAQTLGALTANSKAGRVFNVVSGSITSTAGYVTSSVNATTFNGSGYGVCYPDLGIIVLNPNAICPAVGFYVSNSFINTQTGSAATSSQGPYYTLSTIKNLDASVGRPMAPVTHSTSYGAELSAYNQAGMFVSIRNAITDSVFEFRARSAETISSTHYFVRLRNKEYNYSNNPTFYNSDNGTLVYTDFKTDPKVYITTVGLYNDQNELLAVAKLSKPVRKSFDEELLMRVRLDY